jgi:hypothetical protein
MRVQSRTRPVRFEGGLAAWQGLVDRPLRSSVPVYWLTLLVGRLSTCAPTTTD